MKLITSSLISSLLLSGTLFASSVVTTDSERTPAGMSDLDAQAYMNAIVVEDFHFHQAKFAEAVQKLDEVVSPYGLQILLRETKPADTLVSLKTRDLNMAKNLTYLCKQAGYDWWIEEGVIVVAVPGSNEVLVTEIIPLRSTTATKLAKIQSLQN
ncbi:MAG: hypothetical protein HRT56_00435 [Coraliomargarita sp.]|nr:hypothetical protein [Coraliomargarita sp.]